MAASEMGILGLQRIGEIFDAVQDKRQVPKNLVFRNRINKVPATDADIVAKFLMTGHIADIVPDDQKASTYAAGRVKFETNMIPNLKLGRTMTQEDFKRLEFLDANPPRRAESVGYYAYFKKIAEGLLQSIEWREESLIIGMMIDSFAYNRDGVILSLSWGMDSTLKVTPGTGWANVSATPVSDILTIKLIGSTKYGKNFNRVTMSTGALQAMVKTTEFTNQVHNFYLNVGQPTPSVPYQDFPTLATFVGRILDMGVELYDTQYPTHPTDGSTPTWTRFLPIGKVVIDSTDDDKNDSAKDFATGIPTEAVVSRLPGVNSFGLDGERYGAQSYVTVPADLNAPNATWWGVERGMPRKFDEILCGVLDVGSIVEVVPVGVAF